MQTHGCLQLAEEADKEHKKVADKIAERAELVKVPPMTDHRSRPLHLCCLS
jgi:hypothetical protein